MTTPDPTPPDATATPRTDALRAVPMTRADSDDFARTLERELTAAKAEIARLTSIGPVSGASEGDVYSWLRDAQARAERAEIDNAQLRAMLVKCTPLDVTERADLGKLQDRETAYRATIDGLRAEVERLKEAEAKAHILSPSTQGQFEVLELERDQLRARVAELEAHIVNLLPYANMLLRNEQPMAAYADTLPHVIADAQAALDAARAGKGAT